MATGDLRLRRYAEGSNLGARPDANSPSVRTGDRWYARTEKILSTAVGPHGARTWLEQFTGTGAIGPDEIAFGNAVGGITSSPSFIYDAASFFFAIFDDHNLLFWSWNSLNSTRQFVLSDNAENPLQEIDARLGAKQHHWYDDSNTFTGVWEIFQQAADKRVLAGVPVTLASFTVAALPTPPNGGAGSIAWASNARVGAEGAGAGTGSMVQYKSAGPAGAGWYIPGIATKVTA